MKLMANGEYAAPWKCPHCAHINKDSVHIVYGPWVTCTCGECSHAFDNSVLDSASVASLERARAAAEADPAYVEPRV